jgi:hypothetical protein
MADNKIKLTDREKKMGDALMMTKRGKQVMDAQKRMQEQKEKAGDAKRMRADKLLGVGMNKGGSAMKKATKAGRAMVKKSADTMGRAMKKYAKGGSVAKRADGCATKGHTKGKMVAMNKGGYC